MNKAVIRPVVIYSCTALVELQKLCVVASRGIKASLSTCMFSLVLLDRRSFQDCVGIYEAGLIDISLTLMLVRFEVI